MLRELLQKKKEPANRNYQKELDRILAEIGAMPDSRPPRLLLHCCCAPCSSYVLEYLNPYFQITTLFYNPNISPAAEYEKRKAELQRLIAEMPQKHSIGICDCDHDAAAFREAAVGLEREKEGGKRCDACFALRLRKAAEAAQRGGYDYFASTLSISPLKNAQKLNEIGEQLAAQYGVKHLPNDFKKREGFKRSIDLSKKYGLYRQNYCGCAFSIRPEKEQAGSQPEIVAASIVTGQMNLAGARNAD